MQCRFVAFIFFIIFVSVPVISFCQNKDSDLLISDIQIINLSKALIDKNNFNVAKSLLLKKSFINPKLEIERLFLLGRIFAFEKKYEEAIEIFEFILDTDPTLTRVRFELSLAYIEVNSWYSAEKNLRLALSENNLPLTTEQNINQLLYFIRQNKNWSVGFNFGFAPDNNINNAHDGEECVITSFGVLCRKLPSAEKEVGFNTSVYGSYESKFFDKLHLRNTFSIGNIKYKNKKYDSTNISFLSGPKFIYDSGDIYLGTIINRKWIGHRQYELVTGLQFDLNHDITGRLSINFNSSYNPVFYDEQKFLNGFIKSVGSGFSYTINSFMLLNFRTEREIEHTKEKEYSNRYKNFVIGLNLDLYYGFLIYLEQSVSIQKYYYPRIFVKNYRFIDLIENNTTHKLLISISNKKLQFYKLIPTFRYWYIKRDSNIDKNEYKKHLFDITITRRF